MKHASLAEMTVDQLVDRFAEIGVAQDQALLYDEHKKFNRLFDQMHAVDIELRARGLAARRALLRLFHHQNMQASSEYAGPFRGSKMESGDRSGSGSTSD